MRRTTCLLSLRSLTVMCAAFGMLAVPGVVLGQPLITDSLTVYYDFDEIVQVDGSFVLQNGIPYPSSTDGFADGSGNGYDGVISKPGEFDLTPGEVTLDTTNPKRGAGAVRFTQSTDSLDFPAFVAMDGEAITFSESPVLPSPAFTFAAWVNVDAHGAGDQSVFQTRSSGAAFNHMQVQSSGKLRYRPRGNLNSENITSPDQYWIDGSSTDDNPMPTPVQEWFHYAGTYDSATGRWALYYNGDQIAEAASAAGDIPMGDWAGQVEFGDWFSAGIGSVMDGSGGRRLTGMVDEFYSFYRALTPEEIATLYNLGDSRAHPRRLRQERGGRR